MKKNIEQYSQFQFEIKPIQTQERLTEKLNFSSNTMEKNLNKN